MRAEGESEVTIGGNSQLGVMRASLTLVLLVGTCFICPRGIMGAAGPARDHLIPLAEYDIRRAGPGAEYRKLYEKKLFLTPGDIARYVHAPGFSEPEAVVSVYRRSDRESGASAGYWVTTTQASGSLWACVRTGDEKVTGRKPVDARTIRVQSWDAPLPETTGVAIQKLWLTMLQQIRANPDPDLIGIDSSTEIFSAKAADGRELQGQVPVGPKKNTVALLDIGNLLARYSKIPERQRPKIAREIERAAFDLLGRVTKQTPR